MSLFQYNLFVTVDDQKLVMASTGGGTYTLPALIIGDMVPFSVQLLRKTGGLGSMVYTIINPSGLSLTMAIGKEGDSAPPAVQTSWTISNQSFVGSLDLSPAGLTTEFNSGSQLYFELKVTDSVSSQRVYHQPANLKLPVIPSSVINPTPGVTYPTLAQANATYARKVGLAGESITLLSADGTKSIMLYAGNDGTLHQDQLT